MPRSTSDLEQYGNETNNLWGLPVNEVDHAQRGSSGPVPRTVTKGDTDPLIGHPMRHIPQPQNRPPATLRERAGKGTPC
jgi:hypothetical protein